MEPYRASFTSDRDPPPSGQPPVHTVNPDPSRSHSPSSTPLSHQDPSEPCEPIEHTVNGVRTAIMGYTWPSIEHGEPPSPKYSFFEYVDTVRNGTIEDFQSIQEQTKEWWSPTLDRGAGAVIHFAVDHGRLDMVKYLIDDLKVPVNHQALNGQWTPLHRCARMIHYKHAPYFEIFEFLLSHGADPSLETEDGFLAQDLVVEKGYQWEEGEVRERVRALLKEYAAVPKTEPWFYTGKSVGEVADSVINAWRSLPSIYPPEVDGVSAATRKGVGDLVADGTDGQGETRRSARPKAMRNRLS